MKSTEMLTVLDIEKENFLKAEPTITLNPGKIKCMLNVPTGYCVIVDTLGLLLRRPVGPNYNIDDITVGVGVKIISLNLWGEGDICFHFN